MFSYNFMLRAFFVGIMLAVIIPMIGLVMINRKTSMIGDALSHSSLSGIALGLIFGVNPLWFSLISCIIAAFLIEMIRKKYPDFGDMATAIVMSLGIGLAGILSDFTKGGASLESYLFGSITTLSNEDLIICSVVFLAVVISSLYLYWALLYNSIDETMARLAGVNVDWVSRFFTFLTAITVAISAKMVGALMITSLMVLPVAVSLTFAKSYKETYISSIIFAVVFIVLGIILSYVFGIKTGGATVLVAIAFLLVILLFLNIKRKIDLGKEKK